MTIYLPPDLAVTLRRAAAEEDTEMSAIIGEALAAYFNAQAVGPR